MFHITDNENTASNEIAPVNEMKITSNHIISNNNVIPLNYIYDSTVVPIVDCATTV